MLHFEKDPAVQMLNNKETEDDALVGSGEVASSEPSASASSESTKSCTFDLDMHHRLLKSTKSFSASAYVQGSIVAGK